MNNDLISREALKKALHNFFDGKVIDEPAYILRDVFCHIDNSLSVDISKEVWNKSNELLNKRLSYLKRPQSSLERPLYEGVLFVDDYGINKVIEVDENGTITAQMVIPRDTFIEAYNKFIKGE